MLCSSSSDGSSRMHGAFPLVWILLLVFTFNHPVSTDAVIQLPSTYSTLIDLSPNVNVTHNIHPHGPAISCPVEVPWSVCRRVSHRTFKFLHKVEGEVRLVYTDQKLSLLGNEKYLLSVYTIPALLRIRITGIHPMWINPENITQNCDRQDGTLLFEPPANGAVKIELHLEKSSSWWIRGNLDLFKLGP